MNTSVHYDLSGFEAFLQIFPPEAICDHLANILFDYGAAVKSDMLENFNVQAAWLGALYETIKEVKPVSEEGGEQ